MYVVQILLFLTENTRTSNNNNEFQKPTQILPQTFNQWDLKNSIKYSEIIYEL